MEDRDDKRLLNEPRCYGDLYLLRALSSAKLPLYTNILERTRSLPTTEHGSAHDADTKTRPQALPPITEMEVTAHPARRGRNILCLFWAKDIRRNHNNKQEPSFGTLTRSFKRQGTGAHMFKHTHNTQAWIAINHRDRQQ